MKIEQFVVGINIWRDASHGGPLVQAGELWRHIGYASRKPLDVARVTYLRKNYHFFETSDFSGFHTAENDFFLTMKGLELVIKLRRTREANELKKKLVRGLAELERETPGKTPPGAAPLGGMAYYRGIAAEAKKKEKSAGRATEEAPKDLNADALKSRWLILAADHLQSTYLQNPDSYEGENAKYALRSLLEKQLGMTFHGLHRPIHKELTPEEIGRQLGVSKSMVGIVVSWIKEKGGIDLRNDSRYSIHTTEDVGPEGEKRTVPCYRVNADGLALFEHYFIEYGKAHPYSIVGKIVSEAAENRPHLDLSKTVVVAPTRKRPSGKRNSIRQAISAHQVNGAGSN